MLAWFSFALLCFAVILPLSRGPGFDALRHVLRLSSRLFVSGKRRLAPPALRGGGLAGLPNGLAVLVDRRRHIEAAVHALRELLPEYHRRFEAPALGILDDRRQQALRRDFEDAVIHVTRELDGWCAALGRLDDESRARLHAAGPVPDVPALLLRFPWLPRELHEIGLLHFRDDTPRFVQALFELDGELRRVEEALTSERTMTYR